MMEQGVKQRTWHIHDPNLPADAVYVGRAAWGQKGTTWGNPGLDEAAFRGYATDVLAMNHYWLDPLRGKPLACWCKGYVSPRTGKRSKDKPWCHADILIDLIEGGQP